MRRAVGSNPTLSANIAAYRSDPYRICRDFLVIPDGLYGGSTVP